MRSLSAEREIDKGLKGVTGGKPLSCTMKQLVERVESQMEGRKYERRYSKKE